MHRLDIGNSDFKDMMVHSCYYVDKTMLVRDVLDGSKVSLLPRPRRFGKTLNMTMLRYFFEKTEEDNSGLFEDLKITADVDAMRHRGQYPVIYMSLKDIKATNWDGACTKLSELMSEVYNYHRAVKSSLCRVDQDYFGAISGKAASQAELELSLKKAVSFVYQHSQSPVVILIDEYDSPVIDAYQNGYYDEMIGFMRSWLGGG